ncbi:MULTISPECIES: deoxynucleoside kinase [Shouchella]|uniref:Deoxypurine kinase n=3 Tax=Bacillaceae TaxID=186817 RepID=A0A060M5K1_9BACI|nr:MULTISPECIES: deoxynucleoside kinase [Bacillaceae]AIC95369.1 deoxypurine kinase [Shouchella lehensis G1]KQL55590.1 deoxyguanosine kinase [Alkalicoccobacillus plakortidis]MBG9783836.1 deoxyguanosine kinase [Shouchella lehensis]TES51201.1 deoxynucleoside kinase [Shouchella lehensis]
MDGTFICVEGVIGVGKTTLVTKLSAQFQTEPLYEIVAENPYLEKFYDDMDAWSFQTEMFFLCNRVKQLEDIGKILTEGQPVLSDYYIGKNLIFAHQTLDEQKYDQYKRIYNIVSEHLPKPKGILYLKADFDTIMHRIKQRDRSFERKMDPFYIQSLMQDYDQAMTAISDVIPVLTIDTTHLDFVTNQDDLNLIIQQITSTFGSLKENKHD